MFRLHSIKRAIPIACGVAVLVIIVGCAGMNTGTNKSKGGKLGTWIGGITGAILGKDSKLMGLTTIAGAWAGKEIGEYYGDLLDQEDKEKMKEASLKALSSGEKQSWTSSKKGTSGSVSVKKSNSENGKVCKMLLQTATLSSGEIVNREEKVCLDEDE